MKAMFSLRNIITLVAASVVLPLAVVMATPALAQSSTEPVANPIPPDRFAVSRGGVDMRSGQYEFSHVELSIGGEGEAGLQLIRTNDNNQITHAERFAQFSHNWEIFVTEKESAFYSPGQTYGAGTEGYQISVTQQGRSSSFRTNGATGAPISAINGDYAQIEKFSYGSTYYYVYTAKDGTITKFLPFQNDCNGGTKGAKCAYVSEVLMPSGVDYKFTYDKPSGTARLRRIVSNSGYALLFEYMTSTAGPPYIQKACALNLSVQALPISNTCPSGVPTTSYTYSGQFMTSATDVTAKTWTYANTYTAPSVSYTMSFFRPGEATAFLVNTYGSDSSDPSYRPVIIQQFAGGPTYTYSYAIISNAEVGAGSSEPAGGVYSDGTHSVSVGYGIYRFPKSLDPTWYTSLGPIDIRDELGRHFLASYCVPYPDPLGGCRIVAKQYATDPEGNQTLYGYDSFNNVIQVTTKAKPGSGLADIVETRAYGCYVSVCRAKPTSITDSLGNTATYSYDATHGGVLMATHPAVGGIAPVSRYAYTQRFAWVSNGAGGYTRNTAGIYLLTSEKTCRTTATVSGACAGGASDEVTTSYDYGPDSGPNTLLLRGKLVTADGVSLRTCYGYDAFGNKISETTPRAGLASCS